MSVASLSSLSNDTTQQTALMRNSAVDVMRVKRTFATKRSAIASYQRTIVFRGRRCSAGFVHTAGHNCTRSKCTYTCCRCLQKVLRVGHSASSLMQRIISLVGSCLCDFALFSYPTTRNQLLWWAACSTEVRWRWTHLHLSSRYLEIFCVDVECSRWVMTSYDNPKGFPVQRLNFQNHA